MPVCSIEAPQGLSLDAKKKLMEQVNVALGDAYRIEDVRVFLREYAPEAAGQDGRFPWAQVKPVCSLEVPPGIKMAPRQQMVQKLNAAIAEAYRTDDILIFIREYSLENVGLDGRLQSDNPRLAETLKNLHA